MKRELPPLALPKREYLEFVGVATDEERHDGERH